MAERAVRGEGKPHSLAEPDRPGLPHHEPVAFLCFLPGENGPTNEPVGALPDCSAKGFFPGIFGVGFGCALHFDGLFPLPEETAGLGAAWLYYLITLVPVLGILQVGSQSAADRYTYIPSLAPFLVFASAAAALLTRRRFVFLCLAAALALGLGYGTFRQTAVWRNSITLWETAKKYGLPAPMSAYVNLGTAYREASRLLEAQANYESAIAYWPQLPLPRDGKGRVMLALGRLEEARQEFQSAVYLDPKYAWGHCYLGIVYSKLKMKEKARQAFETALSLPADGAWVHYELGVICFKEGLPESALAELDKSISIEPRNADAYEQKGEIYLQLKKTDEAIEAFRRAVSLEPRHRPFVEKLADAYQQAGKTKEAEALSRKGL